MTDAVDPRERRLVLRLLAHWRDLRGDEKMPCLDQVDGEAIPEMWPWCFMIGIENGKIGRITFAGDWHVTFHGADPTGQRAADLEQGSLLERAIAFAGDVVQRGVPASYGGDLIDHKGRDILYRSILLPLSSDGDDRITVLLGAANCMVRKTEPKP